MKLLIVQPYLPSYRVPFFDALFEELQVHGVTGMVAAPKATGDQAKRQDSSVGHAWYRETGQRTVSTPFGTFTYYGATGLMRQFDGVIVPAAGSCLDTHIAIALKATGIKVGLWGHISNYVKNSNSLDVLVETWLLRRADHVFAYTDAGSRDPKLRKVPRTRVTAIGNTIDTTELERARTGVTAEEKQEFRTHCGISDGPVGLYLGGLDADKRVDILADTLDVLWAENRDFKLIVCGLGVESSRLRRAVDRGQVILMGHANARTKALAAAISSALINPGRIGLTAVDALVLKLPIVTTDWKFHAPEIDYLVKGRDLFSTTSNPAAFAHLIRSTCTAKPQVLTPAPTLQHMVSSFRTGALTMLGR